MPPASNGEAQGQVIPFQAVIESFTDGLIVLDNDYRCTYANAAATTFLRVTPDKLIGQILWEAIVPWRFSQLHEQITRALEKEGVYLGKEGRVWRKDGSMAHLLEAAVLLTNERTGERYIQDVAVDITDRRRAEQALQQLNNRLEEEVQARTEELSNAVDRLQDEVARRVLAERQVRKHSQMLEDRTKQLQRLMLELTQAEDRERKRVAEILHDDLQQVLAAAKFHLGLLDNGVRGPEESRQIARQVKQMLKDAIEKSRSLSHELSPAVLYQSDLDDTFHWLARQMHDKYGLTVHLDIRGPVALHSEPLRALLYKATQELLFNVVKHARANEASIRLRRLGRCICLSVSDRGRGSSRFPCMMSLRRLRGCTRPEPRVTSSKPPPPKSYSPPSEADSQPDRRDSISIGSGTSYTVLSFSERIGARGEQRPLASRVERG